MPNDAAHLVWARQPRRDRLQPVAGAPRRPRPSRRAARRPRPDATGVGFDEVRAGRAGACARCSTSTACAAIRRRRARAASTSTCASSPSGSFDEVRRAALALAREVERRAPGRATSKWWKEERHGVFIDYNQNARDRTVASALLGARRRPTRACRARSSGTRWPTSSRRELTPGHGAGAPAERGDPSADIDERARLARRAARARPRATRRGARRRAVAAALPQAEGRAASACSRAARRSRRPSRPTERARDACRSSRR